MFNMYKIVCFSSVLYLISALPKDEKTDRVFDRELSNKEHFDNDVHNAEYDHEAFLGEDAKTFDQLSPEESKRRLGLIVEKIDNNKDGFISREELKDWIRFTQKGT
ncbi:hypothetical protein HHI36_010585 [Cryptolaemus montrouzieri]|uniref:EF-hand domain-containing protein n=1 Tax=Cryptolaemus montrouzieri TaxID=559131 RepID=A0ABD2MJ47_9CUCU